MAEKERRLQKFKKDDYEAPVAEAAEKIIEKDVNADEKVLEKEIEKELEGKRYVEKEEKSEKVFLSWSPKTKLGKEVKEGKVKNIDEILDNNKKILEDKIVDSLISLKSDLISIGQSKGKFGEEKEELGNRLKRRQWKVMLQAFQPLLLLGMKTDTWELEMEKQKKLFLQEIKQ